MDNERVMLITGTSKGIGRGLAEYFVDRSFHVVGCSRKPIDYDLDNYEHFCLDVSDEADVKRMFNEIRKTRGGLDVLINNAGTASMNHSLLTPIKTARRILDTNVVGTFLFCREAAKLMRKRERGRIINFATYAIPFKLEGEAIYAASKAAVVTLTEILAREYADLGITVNAVAPPAIQTGLVRGVAKETLDALLSRQAIKRFGSPDEVGNVIEFLVRPESDMVTGQTVYLGGL